MDAECFRLISAEEQAKFVKSQLGIWLSPEKNIQITFRPNRPTLAGNDKATFEDRYRYRKNTEHLGRTNRRANWKYFSTFALGLQIINLIEIGYRLIKPYEQIEAEERTKRLNNREALRREKEAHREEYLATRTPQQKIVDEFRFDKWLGD